MENEYAIINGLSIYTSLNNMKKYKVKLDCVYLFGNMKGMPSKKQSKSR